MATIFLIFVIMLALCIVLYLFKNHVRINFKSFFKKGFKLIKDKFGCYCWCGKQGDGKTYSVVQFCLDKVKQNPHYKIVTNVYSFAMTCSDLNIIYNRDFYDIIHKFESGVYDTDYIIFYDEIFTLIEKGKLGKDVLTFISQLRKRGIYLLTTAQEWLEINVTFRRYVRFQIDCKMFAFPFTKTAIAINEINDGYKIHWDNTQNEYVSPRIKTTIKKGLLQVINSYDTYEVIKVS